MKRFLQFVLSLLVAYIVFRLLMEYLRPTRVRLDEEFGGVPAYPGPPQSPPSPPRPAPPDRLGINQADVVALTTLPGVGPKLAERIVAYRKQAGPFSNLDDLTQVSGIGPALLDRLRDLVLVA